MLSWDVGKINPQKLPSLKGTMSLQAGASKPDENPTINIQFKIQQMAISGACANPLARTLSQSVTLCTFFISEVCEQLVSVATRWCQIQ